MKRKTVYIFDLYDEDDNLVGSCSLDPNEPFYEPRTKSLRKYLKRGLFWTSHGDIIRKTGSVPSFQIDVFDDYNWPFLIYNTDLDELRRGIDYESIMILKDLNGWGLKRIKVKPGTGTR